MKRFLRKKEKKKKINRIKKVNRNNNVLLNSLFQSKNMYGDLLCSTHKDTLPFLLGSRQKFSIINLKEVSFFLKRVFKLMQSILKRRKKILIIGNHPEIKFLLNSSFVKKNKNFIFFTDDWVNGFITNRIKNTNWNKVVHYLLKKREIQLILIIKNSIDGDFLNKELATLRIPIISLIGTDQSLKHVQYPILTNLKNIQSIYILMYFFRKLF